MLGVTTTEPYQSTKGKANFIPNRDFLLVEIKRRSEVLNLQPRPHMASKNLEQCCQWLIDHPITDFDDAFFLKREEKVSASHFKMPLMKS
jgi:hypothetical protein